MPSGFKDSNPNTGSKAPRVEELVDVFVLPKKEWVKVRLVGPVWSYVNVWLKIKTKTGKIVSIPKLCLDHNSNTDSYDSETCPYRASGVGRPSKFYLVNAIIRDLQDNEPRKKSPLAKSETQLKDMCGYEMFIKAGKESRSWTPMRVLVVPASLADKLKSFVSLNKHKMKDGRTKTFELSHPKYGIDLDLFYDPDAAGPAKYSASRGEVTPLSQGELDYLGWRLDVLKPEVLKDATREMAVLSKKIVGDDEDNSGGNDKAADEPKRSSGKRDANDRLAKLEELDSNSVDDLDEEDARPAKTNKRRVADLDEEEDARPVRRSASRRDEEEDARPVRRAKPATSSRSRDDDEDARPVSRARRARDEDEE